MPETVVITGASAGVGRATAHAFAARGAQVALIARGTQGLQAAAAEVEKRGGKALDAPPSTSPTPMPSRGGGPSGSENQFGPIDIWVNCAMATIFSPVSSHFEPQEYRRATEVTYLGFVYGTMAALKRMRPPATAARSSRSARRSRTGRYHCSRPIAAPSSRSAASPTACGRS